MQLNHSLTRVHVQTVEKCGNRNFSIDAMVRGYHTYQDSWDATIDEQVPPCKREPGNRKDPFAVAVVRSHCRARVLTVCHVAKEDTECMLHVSAACWWYNSLSSDSL